MNHLTTVYKTLRIMFVFVTLVWVSLGLMKIKLKMINVWYLIVYGHLQFFKKTKKNNVH